MIVLIPAYEPNTQLIDLVKGIQALSPEQVVVVVDDGSGATYEAVFDAVRGLGCDVLSHPENLGKGATLKIGFAHVAQRYSGHDVVCADCDGQHTPEDIAYVAHEVERRDDETCIVLGSRQFGDDVPTRSRFGNDVTRFVFARLTGRRLGDTQTGLRGYSASLLPWLQTIDGRRFEYELAVLLAAKRNSVPLIEVPIEAVYLEGNASSHFHPIVDSIRVYVPFLKFSTSSLVAFALDASLFFVLIGITDRLALSVVVARVVSASVNFTTNRRWVFAESRNSHVVTALRYASLALVLMGVNYTVLRLLTGALGLSIVFAKLLTEVSLFIVSYNVQRLVIFGRQQEPSRDI